MATNKIELVNTMTSIVDEIYRTETVTSVLEAPSDLVRYSDGKSFEIANMTMNGLGDYSRENGYPEGGVSLEWTTYQFETDRGTRFTVDRKDNEESFGIVASRLNGDFTRDHLVPEVDAFRFAKIASNAGKTVTGTITKTDGEDAVDEALVTLQDNKVPTSRLLLFVTPRVKQSLEKGIDRYVSNGEGAINNLIQTYNGVPLIVAPQDRFYSGITLLPGTGENAQFGYEKTKASGSGDDAIPGATDLNFILMDRTACVNITKLNMLKLFTPDENQKKDAWQWDYRLYHECFVFNNKKPGIYVHKKAS